MADQTTFRGTDHLRLLLQSMSTIISDLLLIFGKHEFDVLDFCKLQNGLRSYTALAAELEVQLFLLPQHISIDADVQQLQDNYNKMKTRLASANNIGRRIGHELASPAPAPTYNPGHPECDNAR